MTYGIIKHSLSQIKYIFQYKSGAKYTFFLVIALISNDVP